MPFGITLNLLGRELFDLTVGPVIYQNAQRSPLVVHNTGLETEIAPECDCGDCPEEEEDRITFGFSAPKA